MSSIPTVAIIGFGSFSRLLIRYLSPYANIVVSSRRQIDDKEGLDFVQVDTVEALNQQIIIPSMPAQFLEEFFTGHRNLVHAQALIIDVCSIKTLPVQVYEKALPSSCGILATHPLFGPASAAKSLQGQRIMLHPTRIAPATYTRIKQFLHDTLGLQIIECTPEEHDRTMAYVQGLSHYIGRVMDIMDIPATELMTRAYADLLDMKRVQGADSWELFASIMSENPYAADVQAEFKRACQELDGKISRG